MRNTIAAPIPSRMTRRRRSGGRPGGAIPTTIALSPAKTMSMMSTEIRALNWFKVGSTPAT